MSFLKKKSFAVCAAIGEGAAIVLTLLLLLPVAAVVNQGTLGEATASVVSAVCAGISVLIPTVVIARARGKEALATGGAIALGYLALAALCCALGGSGAAFGMWLAWLAVSVAAGALIGAMLSVRRNSRRKKRR